MPQVNRRASRADTVLAPTLILNVLGLISLKQIECKRRETTLTENQHPSGKKSKEKPVPYLRPGWRGSEEARRGRERYSEQGGAHYAALRESADAAGRSGGGDAIGFISAAAAPRLSLLAPMIGQTVAGHSYERGVGYRAAAVDGEMKIVGAENGALCEPGKPRKLVDSAHTPPQSGQQDGRHPRDRPKSRAGSASRVYRNCSCISERNPHMSSCCGWAGVGSGAQGRGGARITVDKEAAGSDGQRLEHPRGAEHKSVGVRIRAGHDPLDYFSRRCGADRMRPWGILIGDRVCGEEVVGDGDASRAFERPHRHPYTKTLALLPAPTRGQFDTICDTAPRDTPCVPAASPRSRPDFLPGIASPPQSPATAL
ncbi:hypothetical protein C8R46DRAFT_1047663 [Mycena filopes]|nr:hypothetical protein C8R46DRAFT_1047663 [Mycena filopes]